MKTKEILIIFALVVLVTAGSRFIKPLFGLRGQRGFPLPLIYKHCIEGYPVGYSCSRRFIIFGFLLDFLFWFVVLSVGWQVIKWVWGKVMR